MPCYQSWGFDDVGVFIDWPSLFQEPRTEEQQGIFKDSLGAINLWYAHKLMTVYIVSGGEIAALVLIDAVVRLLPSVIGNAETHGATHA